MNELDLAWRMVWYSRQRTLLLLTAVTVAFCTFGILDALRYSIDSGSESISARRLIVTHNAGLMQTLPLTHLTQVVRLSGVKHVSHATWLGSYIGEQDNNFLAFAVDPRTWLDTHPDMQVDASTRAAFLREKRGMLVSAALAAKLRMKVGDAVPVQSMLYPAPAKEAAWTYIVSGIFQPSAEGASRNFAVMHYDYLDDNRDFGRGTVGSLVVTLDPGVEVDHMAQRIDTLMANSAAPTASQSERAFNAEFLSQFGDVLTMIKSVIGVTFTSLMLMVTSAMALSIRQRRRDIGVLRVIGYSTSRIVRLMVTKSLLQIGGGALLGLIFAFVINWGVTREWPEILPDISLPVPVVLQGLGIALALALTAAVIPVAIAVKVKPIEALAQEVA